MANVYWQTGSSLTQRAKVQWPSGGQIIRQVIVAAVVGLVWVGLLVGYFNLTGPSEQVETAPPTEPEAVVVDVNPTDTPTSQPTDTPTSVPTDTPTATDTPSPTPTSETTVAETTVPAEAGDTPAPEPSPTPTDTPSPTPTDTPVPTDTPIPPTDAPIPTDTPISPTDTPSPVVDEAVEVSFAGDVFPILERRCLKCHGGPKEDGSLRIEEGLDMRTHASLLEGSWNGPVIEPGDAEASYLIEQIVSGKMPKREPRLLPGEVRIITDWVNAGAPDN
jgi:hypothetical protein